MAIMETVQFRVPHEVKLAFSARCADEGKTISEGGREAIEEYAYGERKPADELEDIFADADKKLDAAALPEPSVEEIVEFCAKIRAERASQMLA